MPKASLLVLYCRVELASLVEMLYSIGEGQVKFKQQNRSCDTDEIHAVLFVDSNSDFNMTRYRSGMFTSSNQGKFDIGGSSI